MLPLTKRQREILDFLNEFIQQHGYAPSLEEIGRRFNLSSLATVHKHLTNLQEKGFIRRAWNRSRSVELVPARLGSRAVELPLLGYVAAGAPIEAVVGNETIAVPEDLVGKRDTYVLRVKGDSMIDEQIRDGDYVIVEDRKTAENGEMVIALLRVRKPERREVWKWATIGILAGVVPLFLGYAAFGILDDFLYGTFVEVPRVGPNYTLGFFSPPRNLAEARWFPEVLRVALDPLVFQYLLWPVMVIFVGVTITAGHEVAEPARSLSLMGHRKCSPYAHEGTLSCQTSRQEELMDRHIRSNWRAALTITLALVGAAVPQIAYTASKGAVLAMTRELAVIHARENIRVNALSPGPLKTELLMSFLNTEEKRQRRLVHLPMGRFGEAHEIAQAALWLASDESSYVTGTEFLVDGGLTADYVTPE